MALPDAAEAVLRRNRGIQAAKDIRECKEALLDLSDRGLGDEGAKELAEELKVSELVHWELFVVVRLFCGFAEFSRCASDLSKGQFMSCSSNVPRVLGVTAPPSVTQRILAFGCTGEQHDHCAQFV